MRVEHTRVVYGAGTGGSILPAFAELPGVDADMSPYGVPARKAVDAVRILDERGNAQYVVTAIERGDGTPVLTAVWLRAPLRGAMGGASVEASEWLSDRKLAALAVSFMRRRRAELEAGGVMPGFHEPGQQYDETRTPLPRPELEQVAAEARLARHAGDSIVGWLRDRYSISAATAERWIRAARKAGHMPAASAGRPRKTQRPDEGTEL